ncbi:MAG: CRISPR-associated protein [Methylacidiphilales bacterium]|nr:CRISPR-associated protein [Candidatus Methylacidiphilales bacterium]NJR18362.1 CRISPR-associated protein [Calothrix sp. CSU_2_0]
MPVNRPQRPQQDEETSPKPYAFVSFPKDKPTLQTPIGHHKYFTDRLHGTLFLRLKVQTPLHVSTGIVVMGSDIGNNRIPLIKTMVQNTDQKLSIQGSSLKGCIRAVYEAITNSTLAIISSRYRDKIPSERLPCRNKEQLCPTSRVFGAIDWQGLVEFNDAKCASIGFSTGFMPSLYRPRPDERRAYFIRGLVAGRKFYYHTKRAIDKGQNSGIPVQQAGREYIFTTQLNFKNLKPEELGTLLIILGQDKNHQIALKVGGGKPIGMGTMTVDIDAIAQAANLKERYTSYSISDDNRLTGNDLQKFILLQIEAAHSHLIQQEQLQQIATILSYPTDREPPEGMY